MSKYINIIKAIEKKEKVTLKKMTGKELKVFLSELRKYLEKKEKSNCNV